MAAEVSGKNLKKLIGKDVFPPHEVRPPEISNLVASPGDKYLRYQNDVLRFDLMRIPLFDWLFHQRWWQFVTQFPNVLIFNLVILAGFLGIADPTLNFATVITWYLWFTIVFLMMIGIGRGWCLICPFSAQSEWLQRMSIWGKNKRHLTLNKKWPAAYSTVLISVIFFIGLTFFEEYFNIAGPGLPMFTAVLVLGIISWDLFYAFVFERRSFCRYGCPLTGIIGVVAAVSPFEGYRTKDASICKHCKTKECMRGSAVSYGCPWYKYPGSMSSNFNCGICTECVKGCPHNNIGFSVRSPFADTWAPKVKRFEIALSAALLLGLTWFQMVNALPFFGGAATGVNGWLNQVTGWGAFSENQMMLGSLGANGSYVPNPLAFIAFVMLAPAAMYGLALLASKLSSGKYTARKIFTSYGYALIPVFAGAILARQLPKFATGVLLVPWSASNPLGFAHNWNLLGTANLPVQSTLAAAAAALAPLWVYSVQIAMVAVFGAFSLYAARKVHRRDFQPGKESRRVFALMTAAFVLFIALNVVIYYYMAYFNGGHAPF